jgi:hypothetical protein
MLNDGPEVSTTATLQPATPITGFNLSTTPVSCNGGGDGTITATLKTPALGINDKVHLHVKRSARNAQRHRQLSCHAV